MDRCERDAAVREVERQRRELLAVPHLPDEQEQALSRPDHDEMMGRSGAHESHLVDGHHTFHVGDREPLRPPPTLHGDGAVAERDP
ncbi:hypothetical protein D3C74_412540 [compost metagenome]